MKEVNYKVQDLLTIRSAFKKPALSKQMVKSLVLIYAFRKAGINFEDMVLNSNNRLGALHSIALNNLHGVWDCDSRLGDIVADCICAISNENPDDNIVDKVETCRITNEVPRVFEYNLNKSIEILMSWNNEMLIDFVLTKMEISNSAERRDIEDEQLSNLILNRVDSKSLIQLVARLLHSEINLSCYEMTSTNGELALQFLKDGFVGLDVKFYSSDYSNFVLRWYAKVKAYFYNCDKSIDNQHSIVYQDDTFVAQTAFAFAANHQRLNEPYHSKHLGYFRQRQDVSWLMIDRMIDKFNDRAVVLIDNFNLSVNFDEVQRDRLVQIGILEGVIKLPDRFVFDKPRSYSLLVLSKNLPKYNRSIKFLDASDYKTINNGIESLDVDKIVEIYNDEQLLINGEYGGALVPATKVMGKKYNFNLIPTLYTGVRKIQFSNSCALESVMHKIFRGSQVEIANADTMRPEEQYIKVLNVKDVQDGMFDIDSLNRTVFDKRLIGYRIFNGDVILTTKSTIIKSAVVNIPEDEFIIASGNILVLRCDKKKINPVFLKAFLDSNIGKSMLASIQSGSTIITLSIRLLEKMEIPCYSMEKQCEIAEKYLASLQDIKIKTEELKKAVDNAGVVLNDCFKE